MQFSSVIVQFLRFFALRKGLPSAAAYGIIDGKSKDFSGGTT